VRGVQVPGAVVVVTGGSSGIGLATARAFAAEGARLVPAAAVGGAPRARGGWEPRTTEEV
jgi:NAD(P)-dependent dehydrogenase (short-subunit alcohol dehydrogenase family)